MVDGDEVVIVITNQVQDLEVIHNLRDQDLGKLHHPQDLGVLHKVIQYIINQHKSVRDLDQVAPDHQVVQDLVPQVALVPQAVRDLGQVVPDQQDINFKIKKNIICTIITTER